MNEQAARDEGVGGSRSKSGDQGGSVTISKAKDQEELDKQTNMVVGFVSNFFSSYKHISENQAEFFLFVGLAVAAGLAFFLAMVVWGMYRSNRLTRIKNRLRRPGNGGLTTSSSQQDPHTTSDVIDAYLHSPPVSPAHMAGMVKGRNLFAYASSFHPVLKQ